MSSGGNLIRVIDVKHVRDFVLRVRFSDGAVREVDLEPELWGVVFEPLRDPELFRQVRVDQEIGTIVWPNGADLDPGVLRGHAEPADGCKAPAA